jgi:hypothetical protein
MAIRSDSYSSSTAVAVYTRYLLDGESAFNSTTVPTGPQVVEFVDEASGVLNMAIREFGFSPANVRANSTAKLACDSWVRAEAAIFVELTQRGAGYGDGDGSRTVGFDNLYEKAISFIGDIENGFKNEGITVTDPSSQGLVFTAEQVQSERSDPSNTSLQQPKFIGGQFSNK